MAVLGMRCGFIARRVVALMDHGFRNLSEGANSAPEATASDSERGAFTRSGGGSQEILAMVIHVVFLPCLPIVSVACDKNAANLMSQRQGRRRLSGTVPSILVASGGAFGPHLCAHGQYHCHRRLRSWSLSGSGFCFDRLFLLQHARRCLL